MLANHPIFVVMLVAVVAPLLAEIPIGVRVPVIVLELVLGILIGPHGLGVLQPDSFLSKMYVVGTAAVLFMAGMEIDFVQIRGRPLTLALYGWVVSVALAFLAVGLLHVIPGVHAPLMITIALTTTSLGALLPILRDGGQLETPFGSQLLAAGTIGEVGPIVATSLALSGRYSTLKEFGFLFVFLAVVGLAAAAGMRVRPPKVLALLTRTLQTSTQLPVRLAMLVLAALFVVAVEFGFEGILGAFAAGMVVGLATRGEGGKPFCVKIDAVCFGWFTPFFFVGTGMQFDVAALLHGTTTMLLVAAFLMVFLLVRGLPALLYRNDISMAELLPFAFSASVASLGLTVVITQIGLHAKIMNPDIAQALVGAALLSLLLYPTLAGVLLSKTQTAAPAKAVGTDITTPKGITL
jgi:Kef-type K+ transport system membrane component KefB